MILDLTAISSATLIPYMNALTRDNQSIGTPLNMSSFFIAISVLQ